MIYSAKPADVIFTGDGGSIK